MSEENRLVYSVEVTADKIYIIHLKDVFDASTVEEFEHVLEYLIARGQYRLIIDLTRVEFISSAGWGIFTAELKNCHDNEGDIMIVGMQPDVEDVYMLLELDTIMSAYESVEAGLAAMREKFGLPGVQEQADEPVEPETDQAPADDSVRARADDADAGQDDAEQQESVAETDGQTSEAGEPAAEADKPAADDVDGAPRAEDEPAPAAGEKDEKESKYTYITEETDELDEGAETLQATGGETGRETDTATEVDADVNSEEDVLPEQKLNGVHEQAEEATASPAPTEDDSAPITMEPTRLNGHPDDVPAVEDEADQETVEEQDGDEAPEEEPGSVSPFDETTDPWPTEEFLASDAGAAVKDESPDDDEQPVQSQRRRRLSYRAHRQARWQGTAAGDSAAAPATGPVIDSGRTDEENQVYQAGDPVAEGNPLDTAFYELEGNMDPSGELIPDFSHDPLLEKIISVVIANPTFGPSLIRNMLISMNLADKSLTRSMVYRKLAEVNLSTRARRIVFAESNRL